MEIVCSERPMQWPQQVVQLLFCKAVDSENCNSTEWGEFSVAPPCSLECCAQPPNHSIGYSNMIFPILFQVLGQHNNFQSPLCWSSRMTNSLFAFLKRFYKTNLKPEPVSFKYARNLAPRWLVKFWYKD